VIASGSPARPCWSCCDGISRLSIHALDAGGVRAGPGHRHTGSLDHGPRRGRVSSDPRRGEQGRSGGVGRAGARAGSVRAVNGRAPIVGDQPLRRGPRPLFDISVVTGRQLMLGQTNDADRSSRAPPRTRTTLDTRDHSSHPGHSDHSDHMHASYDAVSFVTDQPVDPRAWWISSASGPRGRTGSRLRSTSGQPGNRQRSCCTRWAATCGSAARRGRQGSPGTLRWRSSAPAGPERARRALGACVRPGRPTGTRCCRDRYTF